MDALFELIDIVSVTFLDLEGSANLEADSTIIPSPLGYQRVAYRAHV
jgi:hypothetical protein